MAFTPRTERNLFLWLCEQMATGWWRVLLLFKISRRDCGMPEAFLPTRRAGRGFRAFVLHITVTPVKLFKILSTFDIFWMKVIPLLKAVRWRKLLLLLTSLLNLPHMFPNESNINEKSQLIHYLPLYLTYTYVTCISSFPRSNVYQKQCALCSRRKRHVELSTGYPQGGFFLFSFFENEF